LANVKFGQYSQYFSFSPCKQILEKINFLKIRFFLEIFLANPACGLGNPLYTGYVLTEQLSLSQTR
jgi:hypothetical protein